jgi:type VI secretion system protein ImpI
LNDLRLEAMSVSQFHAIVELQGDKVCVRDLGSKNGTHHIHSGPISPHSPADIGPENRFLLGQYEIRAFVVEMAEQTGRHRVTLPDETTQVTRVMDARPPNPAKVASQIKPVFDAYREAWAQVQVALQQSVGSLESSMRVEVCRHLAAEHPELLREPEFQALSGMTPAEAPVSNREGSADRDAPVMDRIQQMAVAYLPASHTIATSDDALSFLHQMQWSLDVFLKCFIPLRDGYNAFTSQLEIQRAGRTGAYASLASTTPTVATAMTPRDLGAILLDWKLGANGEAVAEADPHRAVEVVFADLMIHHMAMITGVMQGVKSLLAELSPPAIERTLEDPRRPGAGGLQIGPFRYKQLWELYSERHADLSEEQKEAFALIFGPDFARAYTRLLTDTAAYAVPDFTGSHRV